MSSADDERAIPLATRAEIIERDGHVCRLCGVFAEIPHVHHLIYRSQGGQNTGPNLVSLDWKCRAIVHSNKPLWLAAWTPATDLRSGVGHDALTL